MQLLELDNTLLGVDIVRGGRLLASDVDEKTILEMLGEAGSAVRMIVTVIGSGLFVEIDDYGLDGFVGVAQLGQDWFYHDPQRHAQVGERTGRIYRIGQRVRVLLEYVDVGQGRLWLGSIRHLEKRGGDRGRNRE
jgi:exoribonuclease R